MLFLEENCDIFEPVEENKLAYTKIHREYRSLCEELIDRFLRTAGLSASQFVEACGSTQVETKNESYTHAASSKGPDGDGSVDTGTLGDHETLALSVTRDNAVVHTILAMDDFMVFKRIMVQKNIEVELEVVDMAKREWAKRVGGSPDDDIDQLIKKHSRAAEREIVRAVVQRSAHEAEASRRATDALEEEMLRRAIALSLQDQSKRFTVDIN